MKQIPLVFFFIPICMSAFAQRKDLTYFLEKGYQNSPLLADYRNQVAALEFDSLLVKANYKPQIAVNSLNAYAPVVKSFGYDQAVTNGAGLNTVIGVNQAFASRKNLDAQFNTIRIQQSSLRNTAAISHQDLKKTITDQYIVAYGTLQQLKFTNEVNVLLSREDNILKKLTEKNIYRQTDYLTFLVTLQQQQLTARQQDIQFRNDLGTLNYLAGQVDTTIFDLPDPGLSLQSLELPDNSIFFKQFFLDSLGILNSKQLLDISYKPRFSLYADAGYNSSLTYNPFRNFGTNFGVNFSLPIYDGKKRRLQQSKFDIGFQTTNSYKSFALVQYRQQVAQLKQQLDKTSQLIEEINSQIKYSESLITVNLKLLETGDARIADLVIALNNYLTAKNLLTQNTISRMQIINQINYWTR